MSLRSKNNFLGKIIILIWIVLLIFSFCGLMVEASEAEAPALTPRETQYLELKAVTVGTETSDTQVIMELWAHDIEFAGFDVRFQYDTTAFELSEVDTNNPTTDATKFFKFEDEFAGKLQLLNLGSITGEPANIFRANMAFIKSSLPEETAHIKNRTTAEGKQSGLKVVTGEGQSVLLGTLSFNMLADKFDISGFKLVTSETNSPTSGIRIYTDVTHYYIDQSTFRFTNEAASDDANLKGLVVSNGEYDEDPELNTYIEYELDPDFDEEETNYTVTLYDYIDTVDVTATLSDTEEATMTIIVPKREDGELVYEDDDGETIEYEEEQEMEDGEPFEVTLNKLGEPDTIIKIIVTAADGTTTKEYTITIKRPYGIIKGSIHTVLTDYKGTYTSDIRVYKTSDVEDVIDKSGIVEGLVDDIHQQLLTIESHDYKTKDDGTYEIYVVPGTYDILLDKIGYLDHVYESRTVAENQVVDLGLKELLAGDVNKDGVIEITDLTSLLQIFGIATTDNDYNEAMNFNEDEFIDISDLTALLGNYLEARKFE